jgi:hypothetical protein
MEVIISSETSGHTRITGQYIATDGRQLSSAEDFGCGWDGDAVAGWEGVVLTCGSHSLSRMKRIKQAIRDKDNKEVGYEI